MGAATGIRTNMVVMADSNGRRYNLKVHIRECHHDDGTSCPVIDLMRETISARGISRIGLWRKCLPSEEDVERGLEPCATYLNQEVEAVARRKIGEGFSVVERFDLTSNYLLNVYRDFKSGGVFNFK